MTNEQCAARAYDLHRQVRAQSAKLKSYQDALAFVRVRQCGGPVEETVRIDSMLWTIAYAHEVCP